MIHFGHQMKTRKYLKPTPNPMSYYKHKCSPKYKKNKQTVQGVLEWEIIFLPKYSKIFFTIRAKEIYVTFFMGFVYIYENVKHSRSQEDKISKTINGYTVPQDLNQFVYTSQI